jgi:hypothetical protein
VKSTPLERPGDISRCKTRAGSLLYRSTHNSATAKLNHHLQLLCPFPSEAEIVEKPHPGPFQNHRKRRERRVCLPLLACFLALKGE